jgi:hypothetical protein
VNGVFYKPCDGAFNAGACYDCQKFIKNKSPSDLKQFKDHCCKKKQLQRKEIEQEMNDEDDSQQEGNITLMKNQWLEIKNWITDRDDLAEYNRIANKNNVSIASNYLALMRYLFKKPSTAAPDVSDQFNQIMAQLATLQAPAPPALIVHEVPAAPDRDYEKKLQELQQKHQEEMEALKKAHRREVDEYEEQVAYYQQNASDDSTVQMLREELETCKQELKETKETVQNMIDSRKAELAEQLEEMKRQSVEQPKRQNSFKVM